MKCFFCRLFCKTEKTLFLERCRSEIYQMLYDIRELQKKYEELEQKINEFESRIRGITDDFFKS